MIISQKLVQKVQCIVTDESLILCIDKLVPVFSGKSSKDVIVLCVELDIVLVKVIEQFFSSQNLGDLDELIRVGVSVEKWLFSENH